MDQTSGTNPTDAQPAQVPQGSTPAEQQPEAEQGFRSRGQARRRARFLRRARELAYRDLGGLVFNLHRFGQRNDALVLAKLGTLSHIDGELRAIERVLGERRPVTVLREAGITACPRCAAIHGSEDNYCPNCGLPMSRHADLPVAGAPSAEQPAPAAPLSVPAPAPPASQAAAPSTGIDGQAPPQAPVPATSLSSGATPQAQQVPAPMTSQPPGATSQPPGQPAPAATPSETPASAQHTEATGPGRSPLPPPRPATDGDGTAGVEEPTEIIHPQAPGS